MRLLSEHNQELRKIESSSGGDVDVVRGSSVPKSFPADEDERDGRQPEAAPHVPRLLRIVFAPAATRSRAAIGTLGDARVIAHEASLPSVIDRRKLSQQRSTTRLK
jgi:hypothetical protein